jgi:hypothetical protein
MPHQTNRCQSPRQPILLSGRAVAAGARSREGGGLSLKLLLPPLPSLSPPHLQLFAEGPERQERLATLGSGHQSRVLVEPGSMVAKLVAAAYPSATDVLFAGVARWLSATNGCEQLQQGVRTEGTYSITWSARASSDGGTMSPSAFAVRLRRRGAHRLTASGGDRHARFEAAHSSLK